MQCVIEGKWRHSNVFISSSHYVMSSLFCFLAIRKNTVNALQGESIITARLDVELKMIFQFAGYVISEK